MTNPMIDRVALKLLEVTDICGGSGTVGGDLGRAWIEAGTFDAREVARVLIEAMLAPTEAMVKAGTKPHGPTGMCYLSGEAAAIYSAHIDAALKDADAG